MSDEDIKNLTPTTHAERERGSKWVFVSEHAFILCIWSLKACMLVIYSRITYVDDLIIISQFRFPCTDLIFTSEGLKQRKWINYIAIYVALGFVATELSLFLICRPITNYWAVPTPDCKSLKLAIYWIQPLTSHIRSMLVLSIL